MTDDGRTQFADLVRARRQELHLSYRALAAVAVDPVSGVTAKFGWLCKLETGKSIDVPRLDVLRALAAGLDLPVDRLQEAAAEQFFDLERPQTHSAEALEVLDRWERLSPEQRLAITALIEAFTSAST